VWDKIINFLLTQGLLGVAVICLGAVIVLLYKELKIDREARLTEIKEMTTKFSEIATEAVKSISENTNQLKELRIEGKDHNERAIEHRIAVEGNLEKMMTLLDLELNKRREK
jgi:hypothetical protein